MRHLALAHLVEDFAGVCIALGVAAGCLRCGQVGEDAFRYGRDEPEKLESRDYTVAAKDSTEPWHAGIGIEPVGRLCDHHGQVSARAPNPLVKLLVRCVDVELGKRTCAALLVHPLKCIIESE